jgi:hypothetical protein
MISRPSLVAPSGRAFVPISHDGALRHAFISSKLARAAHASRLDQPQTRQKIVKCSEYDEETTRRFAHHGYLAICANLYERKGGGSDANPDGVAA